MDLDVWVLCVFGSVFLLFLSFYADFGIIYDTNDANIYIKICTTKFSIVFLKWEWFMRRRLLTSLRGLGSCAKKSIWRCRSSHIVAIWSGPIWAASRRAGPTWRFAPSVLSVPPLRLGCGTSFDSEKTVRYLFIIYLNSATLLQI